MNMNGDFCNESKVTILDILSGVNPDYAIVAQKQNDALVCEDIEGLFNKNYGLTLEYLAQKFQNRLDEKVSGLDEKLSNMELSAKNTEKLVQELYEEVKLMQASASALHNQLLAIYASTSWQITRPIRLLKVLPNRLNGRRVVSGIRHRFIGFVRYWGRYTSGNNFLRRHMSRVLDRHPKLKNRMRTLLFGVVNQENVTLIELDVTTNHLNNQLYSSRAVKICADLKKAIEKRGI